MPKSATRPHLSRAELDDLLSELRHEFARAERARVAGNAAPDYDDLRIALQRIEDGDYGTCMKCEQPIPYGRLQVMPATRYCITCARSAAGPGPRMWEALSRERLLSPTPQAMVFAS